MTSTENSQIAASRHAAAIERWEDEGGASKVVLEYDRHKAINQSAPQRVTKNKQKKDTHANHGDSRR
jgi:hypothetical protein